MAEKAYGRTRRLVVNRMLWKPYTDIYKSADEYGTTDLIKSDREC
jgi:hypothetical protein